MYQLEDNEVALVAQRLGNAKAGNKALFTDLLDHVCCCMEQEMSAGADFESAWKRACETVCPDGIADIEEELFFLLHFNKQLNMKRILFSSGFLSTFLVSTGILFRTLHWPGQNIILFSGFAALLVTMVVLFIYSLRSMSSMSGSYKARIVLGTCSGLLVAVGSMFKILHYPGANILTFTGMLLLNIVFLPMFFYQLYRRSIAV